ncbi:hypothetical protein BOVA172_2022 [Bacteroides ovatus]|nr:hypothetical protein BOVA172_2022 [Bacteroides ovatus]
MLKFEYLRDNYSWLIDIYYICERPVILLVIYRISFWYIVRWGYSCLYKK